jgi:hypothetical protein
LAVRDAMEQLAQPSLAVRDAMEQLAQPSLAVRDAMEQLAQPSLAVRDAMEQLAQPSLDWDRIVRQLDRLAYASQLGDAARVIAERYSTEQDEDEPLAVLSDQLPPNGDASLLAVLAGLPLTYQVALITAALTVLDKAGRLASSVTGADVSEPVRAATDLLFAVIAFLLIWIEQQSDPSKGSR